MPCLTSFDIYQDLINPEFSVYCEEEIAQTSKAERIISRLGIYPLFLQILQEWNYSMNQLVKCYTLVHDWLGHRSWDFL